MKISYTRYSVIKQCGQRNRLRYHDNVKVPQSQQVFVVGRVVHDVMKDWALHGYPEGNFVREAVAVALSKELKLFQGIIKDKAQEMLRTAVQAALNAEAIYRRLNFPEHHVIVEEWFDLPLPATVKDRLNGAPDIYDPVTKTIYDLKNYSSATSKADPEQLYTYALSERLFGREVVRGAFIYPLRKSWLEEFPITPEIIDAQHDRLLNAIETDKQHRFQANPGDHCIWCEYFRTFHCPETAPKMIVTIGGKVAFDDHDKGGIEPSAESADEARTGIGIDQSST